MLGFFSIPDFVSIIFILLKKFWVCSAFHVGIRCFFDLKKICLKFSTPNCVWLPATKIISLSTKIQAERKVWKKIFCSLKFSTTKKVHLFSKWAKKLIITKNSFYFRKDIFKLPSFSQTKFQNLKNEWVLWKAFQSIYFLKPPCKKSIEQLD